VEAAGHERGGADLRGRRDGERLAKQPGDTMQPGFETRGQQDDRRSTGEGELESHVPDELGLPAEHPSRGGGK